MLNDKGSIADFDPLDIEVEEYEAGDNEHAAITWITIGTKVLVVTVTTDGDDDEEDKKKDVFQL